MKESSLRHQPFFLAINKPAGPTSHDVVATLRAVTGIRKIGHTGTLDPFASGVLVLACNRATRLIQFLPSNAKKYRTRIQLGVETDSGDTEGRVIANALVPDLTPELLDDALVDFVGTIEQIPPIYSAIRVDGKRLYEYARSGMEVEIPPRQVTVQSIQSQIVSTDEIGLDVACHKGTYIRSLGRDIAKRLGTVGHLTALVRTMSEGISMEQTLDYSTLSQLVANTPDWSQALRPKGNLLHPRNDREQVLNSLRSHALSVETVLNSLPKVALSSSQAKAVLNGRSLAGISSYSEGTRMALWWEGKVVAVAEQKGEVAKICRVIGEFS